jgi:hypothetical protein
MMAKLRKIDEARFFFPYEQAEVFGTIGSWLRRTKCI